MSIRYVEILAGVDRDGKPEAVRSVRLEMGEVTCVIGPTGSGKTALITDIELLADKNTPSGRRALINGNPQAADTPVKPANNPIAMITQHTNFLSDLPVDEFLSIHARVRGNGSADMTGATLDFANQLTGEPVNPKSPMTQLSGGQTRALLIADAVVIGAAPILLLDEIENAGINRARALELLRMRRKIFIFVTHDPRIALLSDLRIVMAGGGMVKAIRASAGEKALGEKIAAMDLALDSVKRRLWEGGTLDAAAEEALLAPGAVELAGMAEKFGAHPSDAGLIGRAMALGAVFGGKP